MRPRHQCGVRRPEEHTQRVRQCGREMTRDRHTSRVGFDPTRKHKRTRFDYFYVAASVIVCVALVTWAFLS
jgi:hypothetical protein